MKEPVVLPQPEEMPEKYPNRFKPGQSGNPGGRPKKTPEELQAIAELKRMTPEAVKVVVSILKKESASLYARLQAAEIIFNRAILSNTSDTSVIWSVFPLFSYHPKP